MDPSNDFVKMKSGMELYVDTSYEPEKHVVRVGTVIKAPKYIIDSNSPWKTTIEIKEGDRVVMYFLAVQNCMSKERKHYWVEGIRKVFISIKYQNIYAVIGDGFIKPVNGYLLVEPVEDPDWIRMQKLMALKNMELADLRTNSNVNVTYGIIKYMGEPNLGYNEDYKSDEHYNLAIGDTVVMKRIRDIPAEYEYHAKMDGGGNLYRVQRHDILAKL